MLVWVLAALAGVYTITLAPAAVGLAVAAILVPPRILTPRTRLLDGSLIACVVFVLLQLMPLPPSLRHAVTPHALGVEAALTLTPTPPAGYPVTLDPEATRSAAFIVALLVAMFFVTREVCAEGGVRRP